MDKKRLPVGIEDFEEIRTDNYYYVDKTALIAEILKSGGKVTLFTRPRRFGKTLNMSMLEKFFSPYSDKGIFEGTEISGEKELCGRYMGKAPVISVSLNGVNAGQFDTALAMAVRLVRDAAKQYEEVLLGSEYLTKSDKADFEELLDVNMPQQILYRSLKLLSGLLEKHYGQKAVILIDEYDVPLAKAYEQGYYDQMAVLIRNLFEQTLKTNSSFKFAVLTGCMRISKESIFTGLNNLEVRSVSDEIYDEYFGFTDAEVRDMLEYYGKSEYFGIVKEWYDGYLFGRTNVYCPWDVVCYCKKLCTSIDCSPENYWLNSSGNFAVRKFIECSTDTALRGEIERLINGESVEKTIRQDLTYDDMYASVDNIWSVLYTTGYLTQDGRSGNRIRLVIPNIEICNIFSEQLLELFREDVRLDGGAHAALCLALQEGDTGAAQEELNGYLRRTVSIRDTAVRNALKENFYHGILLGILSSKTDWVVLSNQESGNGYSDIQVCDEESGMAIVIEVKYAENGNLEETALAGLMQIEEKRYADKLLEDQYKTVRKYGIAFYRKECRIVAAG